MSKDFTSMSVNDIRAELVALGMSVEDADAIKGKSNLIDKYNNLAKAKEIITEANSQTLSDFKENLEKVEINIDVAVEPVEQTNIRWHDYVMSQFADDEVVIDSKENKYPTVDGLRRVVKLLLGKIIASQAQINHSPTSEDRICTVTYTISIKDKDGDITTYSGCADGGYHNIESFYTKHVVSVTETRAEGRALRKALGLRKVICAEETDNLFGETVVTPVDDSMISAIQINLVDRLCKSNDINVMKFINSHTLFAPRTVGYGEKTYTKIKDIKKDDANVMLQVLNDYNRDSTQIPSDLLGYDTNWSK